MPKINAYLNADMIKNLKSIQETSGEPLSKIVADLIISGYRVMQLKKEHETNEKQNKIPELETRTIEYILRILAITTDTYRCVRNEKSRHDAKNFDEAIDKITNNVLSLIH